MRAVRPSRLLLVAAAALAAALVAAPAALPAPPEPEPYGTGDFGGFRDVLPPGTNGLASGPELGAFLSSGARPRHNDDQLPLYRDLLYAPARPSMLERFFKDSTFGVKDGDVERRYSPRYDVTIVRDAGYGVPHIYGRTRDGAMFGIGYATAEDRLFFMDVFRHLGRADLSSFVGGAPANREFDRAQWAAAPYTEADLQRQIDQRPPGFKSVADRLRRDLNHYVAGINRYIAEARLDPRKMPGEYAAIGRPQGPENWRGTDTVATAAVVGAIFGVGGGQELDSALVLQQARARFGPRRGTAVWRDFRSAEDPESPTTVRGRAFPYQRTPRRVRGLALPDRGSVRRTQLVTSTDGSGGGDGPGGDPPLPFPLPRAQSNALVVSARESQSRRPIAVFGPQTAYFAPQVLIEQDVHAPTLEARGVAFPGTNLYVQLGHGRDYAWSATTSGQDIVDTFAVDLCEPDGGKPSLESMHYRFRGRCLPIEVLEHRNSWAPTAADQTPAGSETLHAERTKLGLVTARATLRRRPVAYVKLRSTYLHETDSSVAFSQFNDPNVIRGPRSFQRAASLVQYTFNWFYVDDRHTAYQNAGANPVRARGAHPDLPLRGTREWRDFDSERLTATYTPRSEHPNALDQSYIADWNNKQARGYRAADGNWAYGSPYRVKPLVDRIRSGIRGPRRMSRVELVDAMRDAATVDLRGDGVLPEALRVIGRPSNPALRRAVARLRAWQRAGAHRRDLDRDGAYEHADAIRIMDAWWPRWMDAQFRPVLGRRLFEAIQGINELSNDPNNHGAHLGSAWQNGWYGYARKDLRTVRGARVRGRYSRRYCGRGSLRRCRRALRASLAGSLKIDPYGGDPVCRDAGREGDQACYDAIFFRPLGGITQPLIPWQNRPTYQQVVEVQGHRRR